MELENRDFVGDFLGFSYNDTHSSTLGLVRVSAGNRYSKNLFPAFANKTVQPEGKDGFYYFGAYYTNNQFQVETAFDNLSEVQFQKLSTAFSCKQFKELWFDETPYKAFWAKLAEAPQIKYMCFTGDNGQRVYKGDVTFKFETLEPWAHNRVCNVDDEVMIIKKTSINNEDESYVSTIAPPLLMVGGDYYKYVYEEGKLYESFNYPDWNNEEFSITTVNDEKVLSYQSVKEGDYLLSFNITRSLVNNVGQDMFYKISILYGNNDSKYFILKIRDKIFKKGKSNSYDTSYKLYIDSKKQVCYIIKNNKKYILNIELIEDCIFKLPQTFKQISVTKGTNRNNINTTINENEYEFKPYYYFY